MGRAAGDGKYYTFVLRDLSTGRYDQGCTISFPSVTTIIGRVLAKPALIPWTYRETRDAISGLVSVLLSADREAHPDIESDILDLLSDPDMLEEYMKENGLRPEDQKLEAADRGKKAHTALEDLATIALKEDSSAADALAGRLLEKPGTTPFDRATAAWWLDREPEVIATEARLFSLHHGFAGSADLVWRDRDGYVVMTDLKSRRASQPAWESDHIQVGAYSIAWEERTEQEVERETVLVVREDGTWDEYESRVDNRQVFLDLNAAYKELTGGK